MMIHIQQQYNISSEQLHEKGHKVLIFSSKLMVIFGFKLLGF